METLYRILACEIDTPPMYGWFHFLWVGLTVAVIVWFAVRRKAYGDKQLNLALKIYGWGSLVLELLKQWLWTYNVDTHEWHMLWYCFPFQLCTTPMFAALIAAYAKSPKVREWMLSYMAYVTIISSLAVTAYPSTVFVRTLEVDIHTMYLHCGALAMSVIIWIMKRRSLNRWHAFYTFLIFVAIAMVLNLVVYNTGWVGDGTFNMFYISPYYTSSLPVFSMLQPLMPYPVFLALYLFAFLLGIHVVHLISRIGLKKETRKAA